MMMDRMLSAMRMTKGEPDPERVRVLLRCMIEHAGGQETDVADLGAYVFEAYKEACEYDRVSEVMAVVALVELDEGGKDGRVYELGDEPEVVLGRDAQMSFDDEFLSPQHALLIWREGRLFVRDLDSINGSFVRVNGHMELKHEDVFLAGRQVLQFLVEVEPVRESNGTRLMGSPTPDKPRARVAQVGPNNVVYSMMQLGEKGIEVGRNPAPEQDTFTTFVFDDDRFQSERHLKIVRRKGRWVLEDMNSSNGTWIRLDSERELLDGDFLFVGALLFRVVINGAQE